MKRQEVDVARGRAGVAVGPVPGSTPFMEVYVPVEGRVYKINVYSDGSPYGGRGLKVVRHHYFRGKGGVYTFGCRTCKGMESRGDLISN